MYRGSSNIKFHLIAGTSIVLLSALFFWGLAQLVGTPKDSADDSDPTANGRYIQISRASYGLNCNELLELTPSQIEERGYRFGNQQVEKVQVNNVLEEVSYLCNDLDSCDIEINPDTFGFDPLPSCRKTLELEFRCELVELPRKVTGEDRTTLHIECP